MARRAEDLVITFARPARKVRFVIVGVNDEGKVGTIVVRGGDGAKLASVPLVGKGEGTEPVQIDLSDYADVGTITVQDVTDFDGIGLDDLSFELRD